MPLYDYECPVCEAQKEVQHAMSEIGKAKVICDQCGKKMNKMLSAPTLLGFDEVGRSISKKEKEGNNSAEGSKPVSTEKKSSDAA